MLHFTKIGYNGSTDLGRTARFVRTVQRGRTVDFHNYIPVHISQVLATTMDKSLEMELAVAEGCITSSFLMEYASNH